MKSTRMLALLLMTLLVGLAGGCFLLEPDPARVTAVISPAAGNVPYTAQIVATAPAGTFTFQLPEATVTQTSGVLEVLVDRIEWSAVVSWTDGKSTASTTVSAHGTNPRPTIHRPLINGIADTWYLEPMKRTLVEFHYHPASMTSPTTGVEYAGEWSIREISVECSGKPLCEGSVPDSIYCPPYQPGAFHAMFNGRLHEDACIVYPTVTCEIGSGSRPYAPAPEDGYVYDVAQNRSLFDDVVFPAQTATIRVVVEDDFGRLTEAAFEIPVLQLVVEGVAYPGGDHSSFDRAVYYVANKTQAVFHQHWCTAICAIPEASRLYFVDMRHAIESGRNLDSNCVGEQPGPCDCLGEDLDCEDFASQGAAQNCFDYCRNRGLGDIHHLDADGDGIACED